MTVQPPPPILSSRHHGRPTVCHVRRWRQGARYDKTADERERRTISWQYQLELVKATPKPKHWLPVRLEDFVLRQDETLARLEQFLGFPLAKIPVKPDVIGRWKQDAGKHTFDFFKSDLVEHGYNR